MDKERRGFSRRQQNRYDTFDAEHKVSIQLGISAGMLGTN
jgi:hypothetical protein